MRIYKVPDGHHHTHAGVEYLGPADIPMSDEDHAALVGTVMEARKHVREVNTSAERDKKTDENEHVDASGAE